jgi:phage repressor protein C with HTH and peptisase S24 domain
MRPRIKNGEYVIIEPGHPIQPGDEVLVRAKDGRVMVKELAFKAQGRTHLLSVNEAHGKLSIDNNDIEKMHYVAGIAKRSMWRPD